MGWGGDQAPQKASEASNSPPFLSLSNRYAALADSPSWSPRASSCTDPSAPSTKPAAPFPPAAESADTEQVLRDLFWNSFFYRTDSMHPNRLGSLFLAANLQHAVKSASHAWVRWQVLVQLPSCGLTCHYPFLHTNALLALIQLLNDKLHPLQGY